MQFCHQLVDVNYMKLVYVRGSEEDGAKFWLKRVGWEPSEVARKIAKENDPKRTSYVADIGGGHGREALWLAEQGFPTILVEPNNFSLRFAKERAKTRGANLHLINAALPYLPFRAQVIEIVDFYWALHQIPDEHKLESLKEIQRILEPNGTVYSTSFGHWEGHSMPSSIYPITRKEDFMHLHVSAGFKPRCEVKERSDDTNSFEKFWFGAFQKKP